MVGRRGKGREGGRKGREKERKEKRKEGKERTRRTEKNLELRVNSNYVRLYSAMWQVNRKKKKSLHGTSRQT